MEELKIENLLNLNETIAKGLFLNKEYPWQVISKINEFIIELGNQLDENKFYKMGDDIWIAKSAIVDKTASINGPVIIDENAEIRHSAYIRGCAIIGKNAVIGNSTEIKNAIIFNDAQIPHFNYVGDSIIGYKAHMGAGSILSNVRLDYKKISIFINNQKIETDLFKFGAILGDEVQIGCGSVINPGSVISRNKIIMPLSTVSGYVK